MKRTRIMLWGFSIITALLFLIPNSVIADFPNITFLAGWYGDGSNSPEDPLCPGETDVAPARHPQNAAYGSYLVVVYALSTTIPDSIDPNDWIWNIRLAISSDHGTSWSSFSWVDYNENVQQDYPDVQVYRDHSVDQNPDPIKIVVVWQERNADGSNEWRVKAKVKNVNSSWSSTDTISDPNDTKQNIYPKISVCSDNDDDITYWNVVWQRDYYTNRFGVKLRRFVDDGSTPSFCSIENIEVPSDSDEDFKHPAIDCIVSANDYQYVFIIYDVYYDGMDEQEIDSIIRIKKGYPSGSPTGTFTISNSVNLEESDEGDYSLGYPDITVENPITGGGCTVDCVWVFNEASNKIHYQRSTNGGTSYSLNPADLTGNEYGDMSLRSVAIEMFIKSSSPLSSKSVVVWTDGDDVFYRLRNNNNATWESVTDGATTNRAEIFVDVAISKDSSTLKIHVVWQDSGTAVWYGRTS